MLVRTFVILPCVWWELRSASVRRVLLSVEAVLVLERYQAPAGANGNGSSSEVSRLANQPPRLVCASNALTLVRVLAIWQRDVWQLC